jgi:hypothetical protein
MLPLEGSLLNGLPTLSLSEPMSGFLNSASYPIICGQGQSRLPFEVTKDE